MKSLRFAAFAVLALMACMAFAGHPLIDPDVFAGLAGAGVGLMPFVGEVGGDVKKMLGELTDTAKAAKEAVDQVRKSHTELDGRVAKLHEELKTGQADTITKAAFQDATAKVDKVEKALDKLNTELTELAAKAANGLSGPEKVKTLGQLAAESEVCKTYRGGMAELCQMSGPLFGKAANTSAAASSGALINPYRVPGIIMDPDTPTTVRDLFAAVSISTNAIEWVKEKAFTNGANYQRAEGDAKSESGLTFEKMTSAVATIAHWIPASRQVLADAPQLRGVIDGKLRTGLKLKEDAELLFGDGLNGSLHGIVPQSTAYVNTGIPAGANKIDHLRWAFLQVSKAKYPATWTLAISSRVRAWPPRSTTART